MDKKILFRPISPFRLSQAYGQNGACVSLDGSKKVITCDGKNPPEGYKSLYGPNGHSGIDLPTKHGQEVYAAQDGIVYQIDTNTKTGLDVRIESEVNGIKIRHVYEHLMGYQVVVGQKVGVGDLIGWADNTGYSSGDHLHFQIYIKKGEKWFLDDPMQYMSDVFALDGKKNLSYILYLKELLAKLLDKTASNIRNGK